MKNLKLIFVFLLVFLTACGNNTDGSQNEETLPTEANSQEENNSEESTDVKEISKDSQFNFENIDALDIAGNKVDGSLFKGKYTLVNVWGTFCNPCIEEIPDLAKISDDLSNEKFQVVGIISDSHVSSQENLDTAKDILDASNAKYTNIIPDDEIVKEILSKIQYVPTTFLLDENGQIVDEIVLGSRDYNFFNDFVSKNISANK